jgi:hypothetical protein
VAPRLTRLLVAIVHTGSKAVETTMSVPSRPGNASRKRSDGGSDSFSVTTKEELDDPMAEVGNCSLFDREDFNPSCVLDLKQSLLYRKMLNGNGDQSEVMDVELSTRTQRKMNTTMGT